MPVFLCKKLNCFNDLKHKTRKNILQLIFCCFLLKLFKATKKLSFVNLMLRKKSLVIRCVKVH